LDASIIYFGQLPTFLQNAARRHPRRRLQPIHQFSPRPTVDLRALSFRHSAVVAQWLLGFDLAECTGSAICLSFSPRVLCRGSFDLHRPGIPLTWS
jgi:hypothetical protein